MGLVFRAIFLLIGVIIAQAEDVWHHDTVLDPHGKFHLKWNINNDDQEITFLVEVQTQGWFGFGISPNGGMPGSDIVTGWIDDSTGRAYFHDRYAYGSELPIIDDSQDWKFISGNQNGSHTNFKFSRAYKTCDHIFDYEITEDTMRIIYAFSDQDPRSANDMQKHLPHERGAKSVILLTEPKSFEVLESDAKVWDILAQNVTIPHEQVTTYHCIIVKVPHAKKRHVVRFDPVITPGNEQFVHHMGLYRCNHPDVTKLDKYLGAYGHPCTDTQTMPPDFLHCQAMYMVWAVGGQPMVLPKEAGFPIGDEPETTYFLLEMHYDNPGKISGKIDRSGLRLFHTKQLRKHDAYTAEIGSVTDFRVVIPPRQPEYKVTGHCDPRCYKDSIPTDGIKVFATMVHGHLLSRKIKTRHFRAGTELEPIVDEKHYDFNFQEFRNFREEKIVLPGDHLTTECVYNSSQMKIARLGGLATREEMCLTFLVYYPKLSRTRSCMSGLTPSAVMALAGVEQLYDYQVDVEPTIKSPDHLKGKSLSQYLLEKDDWDDELISKSQYLIQYSKHRAQCYWRKVKEAPELPDLVGYPKITQPYVAPVKQCKINNFQAKEFYMENAAIYISPFIGQILIFVFFALYM